MVFSGSDISLTDKFLPEGLLIRSQTAANLAALTNSQGGILLYDSTNNLGKDKHKRNFSHYRYPIRM